MDSKMKNLIIRTASGVVMLVVLLGAILASRWSFAALMAVIAIGGMWEFYRIAEKAGYQPLKWLGLFFGAIILLTGLGIAQLVTNGATEASSIILISNIAVLVLLPPTMLICELFHKSTTPVANVGTSILGALYVALPMALLLVTPLLLGQGEWNPWYVLFIVFIIWANDVFAYLFGITLGRHRLFERISPKKSWEGFFGGLLGAMVMGYIASICLEANAVAWILLALAAAISGVLGDLIESLFKRSVDIKDSGNCIPGHGGWLDRFDALIFASPFVFVYACIYTIIF